MYFLKPDDREACTLFLGEHDGLPTLLLHKVDPLKTADKGSFSVYKKAYNFGQIHRGTFNIDLLMNFKGEASLALQYKDEIRVQPI